MLIGNDIVIQKETEAHFLFPSTICVSKAPMNIQTLLGSCIAVCLYDQRLRTGGMNHYMMPMWNDNGLASPKFGNIAIDDLVQKMIAMGSQKKDLIAKIFGGASQYEYDNHIIAIGEKNIRIAESMLSSHRISIVAQSVGGEQGRKIIFNTATGQVMMKFIEKQKNGKQH
jgi:chemotaxis protein CheD